MATRKRSQGNGKRMLRATAKAAVPVPAILAVLIQAGCSREAGLSPAAPAPVDASPPAIPTGLAAAESSAAVKLAWDPNTLDADFAGFLVYRLAFDNAYLLTSSPIAENRYVDRRPLDFPCGYAVSAVDDAGNESAWRELRYSPGPDAPEIGISR